MKEYEILFRAEAKLRIKVDAKSEEDARRMFDVDQYNWWDAEIVDICETDDVCINEVADD